MHKEFSSLILFTPKKIKKLKYRISQKIKFYIFQHLGCELNGKMFEDGSEVPYKCNTW